MAHFIDSEDLSRMGAHSWRPDFPVGPQQVPSIRVTPPQDFWDAYYETNYLKVASYPRFVRELLAIIKDNIPEVNLETFATPEMIIGTLKSILQRIQGRNEKYREAISDSVSEAAIGTFDHELWISIFGFIEEHNAHPMANIPEYFQDELDRMNRYNITLKERICHMEPKISDLRKEVLEANIQEGYGDSRSPRFNYAEWMARLICQRHMNNILLNRIEAVRAETNQFKPVIAVMQNYLSHDAYQPQIEDFKAKTELAQVIRDAFASAVQGGHEYAMNPSEEVCEQILEEFENLIGDLKNAYNQNLEFIAQEIQRYEDIQGRLENEIAEFKKEAKYKDYVIIELNRTRLREIIRINESSPPDYYRRHSFDDFGRLPSRAFRGDQIAELSHLSPQDLHRHRTVELGALPSVGIDRQDTTEIDHLPELSLERYETVALDDLLPPIAPTASDYGQSPPIGSQNLSGVVDMDRTVPLGSLIPSAAGLDRVDPLPPSVIDLNRPIELDQYLLPSEADRSFHRDSLEQRDYRLSLPPIASQDLNRMVDMDRTAQLSSSRPLAAGLDRVPDLHPPARELDTTAELHRYLFPSEGDSRSSYRDSQDFGDQSSMFGQSWDFELPAPTFDHREDIDNALRELNEEVGSMQQRIAQLIRSQPDYYNLGNVDLSDSFEGSHDDSY